MTDILDRLKAWAGPPMQPNVLQIATCDMRLIREAITEIEKLRAMIPPEPENADRLFWLLKPIMAKPFVIDNSDSVEPEIRREAFLAAAKMVSECMELLQRAAKETAPSSAPP